MSVRDHISLAPFVTEVLLYDRLIIPVPPDKDQDANWEQEWQPELLHKCLEILKVKTDETDGLALTVPWDQSKRERFQTRMSTAVALATQRRDPAQTYYMDPFQMTRALLKDEFRPALPRGVSKAWTVASYPSAEAFRADFSDPLRERKTRLAVSISHRFFVPSRSDPKHEMLRRAVGLSSSDEFRRKRARFYEWQEEIIQEEISDEKAIEELEQRLTDYNEATEKAFVDVAMRFAFTVIPVALAGAFAGGAEHGLLVAGATGLVQLARFWKFDRKPVIANGDLDAAAMVHDAEKVLRV
jgi:hypothetical protein